MKKRVALSLSALAICSLNVGAAETASKPQVRIETSMGTVVVELDQTAAPKTVANFMQYVKDGFYDGTIFHRVIKNFMVQGGGFAQDMNEKPTRPPVVNEADNGLKNDLGTIAMARTNDPQSATAQFFINTKNNDFLNFRSKDTQGWGYCVFGKVVEGLNVVTAIENVQTTNTGMFQDVPASPVVMKKVTMVGAPAAKAPATKTAKGASKAVKDSVKTPAAE